MLDELSNLLNAVPGHASREDYADAVVAHNCLGKRTAATRKLSLQRMTELYALKPQAILFAGAEGSLGKKRNEADPFWRCCSPWHGTRYSRATTTAVMRTPYGHEFARQSMKEALTDAVGDRLNEATLDKVVRNASSSWTQSGHFRGRGRKTRQKVEATPPATMFALLIGFAVGRRGRLLFETPWAAVLDAGPGYLVDVAVDAKRLGLLDFKQSGSMIDVSFPALFADKEQEMIHGAD